MTAPPDSSEELERFLGDLHSSSKILSYGIAGLITITDIDKTHIPAVEIMNLYGQKIVWGMFSIDRGKFRGRLANNANTEGVIYTPVRRAYNPITK